MADQNPENSKQTPDAAARNEATSEPATTPEATTAEPESAPEASAPQPAAAAAPAEPAEVLAPKERRRRARVAKAEQDRPRQARTPEERHAERLAERRVKARARRARRLSERSKAAAAATDRQATPPREHGPGKQKTRLGVVVSDRADKTITVRIDVTRRHRRYAKIVRTSNTLHAHDERNDAHTGDTVIVRESRPLSRSKRWRLVEVVERAR
jgi:small subunit ribosomal protein S17